MKFVSYFKMMLILIVLFSVSTVAADDKKFKLIEQIKSQATLFNNKQLSDEILIKYLQQVVPQHFKGTSKLYGLWGVYREGRKATVYFRVLYSRSAQTESFQLVRLDSGFWFNITRGIYVMVK